jgi:FixJ family two-component response regulator
MEIMIRRKASKVIAWDLSISERTVEVRRRRVMQKVGVTSLDALVRMSIDAERGQRVADSRSAGELRCGPLPPD